MAKFISVYIKEFLRFFYWGPLRLLVQALPLSISYAFITAAGFLYCAASGSKARLLRRWYERLPQAEGRSSLRREVADTFILYCKNSLDSLLYPKLNISNIGSMVEYEGLERLEKALAAGKGAILLYLHFGNEEFLMPALGHKGFSICQVASRKEPEYLRGAQYRLANAVRRYAFGKRIGTREALPVDFVYVDAGVRGMFRSLESNSVLLLSIDGREGKGWTEVDFLGAKAVISTGPMKLAASTGSPVLMAMITRKGLYRQSLRILEPLKLDLASDREESLAAATREAMAAIEPYALRDIAHYGKLVLFGIDLFKDPPWED